MRRTFVATTAPNRYGRKVVKAPVEMTGRRQTASASAAATAAAAAGMRRPSDRGTSVRWNAGRDLMNDSRQMRSLTGEHCRRSPRRHSSAPASMSARFRRSIEIIEIFLSAEERTEEWSVCVCVCVNNERFCSVDGERPHKHGAVRCVRVWT